MTIKQDIERYYNFWFTTDKIYDTWAKKQGISINELFVLFVIAENPNTCTQQRICQKLLLPKQTVNSILLKFEKEGYVKKQPSRQDRRSKILTFTEEGQRCLLYTSWPQKHRTNGTLTATNECNVWPR